MTLALEFPAEWADDLSSSNKTVTHQLYETLNIGDETSAVSGDIVRKIRILDKVWVPKEQLDSETFSDISRTSPQDFSGVYKITFEYLYDPPYTMDEIEDFYPEKAEMLLRDPIHKWRAETGIELIHEEPDNKELNRIWQNWQLMPEELKKISDEKSLELFGLSNEEHYKALSRESRISKIVLSFLRKCSSKNLEVPSLCELIGAKCEFFKTDTHTSSPAYLVDDTWYIFHLDAFKGRDAYYIKSFKDNISTDDFIKKYNKFGFTLNAWGDVFEI